MILVDFRFIAASRGQSYLNNIGVAEIGLAVDFDLGVVHRGPDVWHTGKENHRDNGNHHEPDIIDVVACPNDPHDEQCGDKQDTQNGVLHCTILWS